MIAKRIQKEHVYIADAVTAGLVLGIFVYFFVRNAQYQNKILPGISVDGINVTGQTQAQVEKTILAKRQNLKNTLLEVSYEDTIIATFSAKTLDLTTNYNDIAYQAYLLGRSSHWPTAIKDKVLLFTGLKTFDLQSSVVFHEGILDEFLSNTKEAYTIDPVDALFNYTDGKLTEFKEDKKGMSIDVKAFKNEFQTYLDQIKEKKAPIRRVISLKKVVLEPKVTLAKSNDLGIEELIGEGKSDYSHSSAERIFNLTLAAWKYHGVIIPPGEDFSFNKIIGDISAESGFKQSYVIKNGRTVLGDGGGVCQVSTTMFRAALHTGLPIVERHAHAYRVGYYENDAKPGFDATIYTPDVDFRFKNNTGNNILIQTVFEENSNIMYFRFYGKSDGRKVELSEPLISNQAPPPPELRQDDPTLPNGTVKQVDYAASGAKSVFHYKVTRDGKILEDEDFNSVYKPWQAVYLIGTG